MSLENHYGPNRKFSCSSMLHLLVSSRVYFAFIYVTFTPVHIVILIHVLTRFA